MKPRIGVTGPDRGGGAAWIMTSAALRRAGGRPVRITPTCLLEDDRLDGLVLGGGADVDPELYSDRAAALGEVAQASAQAVEEGHAHWRSRVYAPAVWLLRRALARPGGGNPLDAGRDALERDLLSRAIERDQPFLAICRGAQLVNVHFGGTLYAELHEFYVETPQLRTVLPRKAIEIEPHSQLAALLGTTSCRVNALHRQAIRTVGKGLEVVARESTGVVQAIEQPDHPFRIGVQWHPEYIPQHRRQRGLFEGLVAAARRGGVRPTRS